MKPTAPKTGRVDPRTCRPDAAYRIKQADSQFYTAEFSRILGLKPANTAFGTKVLKI